MFVVYIERQQRDKFSCIDHIRTVHFIKAFTNGGLLYGYVNQFNTITIDKNMIISIDGRPGEYKKKHGTFTEITDNFSKGA